VAIEFLAAIVAAFALAGVALAARRLSGGRLATWTIPAAAAFGLLGFTVWSEYDWFGRVRAELPEGVVVVWAEPESMALRPWTLAAPLVLRFVALDTRSLAPHPANPALRLAEIYTFARWRPVAGGLLIVDCAGGRRVAVTAGVAVTPEGELTGAAWQAVPQDDATQAAACGEG
jgi:hypothetical protein